MTTEGDEMQVSATVVTLEISGHGSKGPERPPRFRNRNMGGFRACIAPSVFKGARVLDHSCPAGPSAEFAPAASTPLRLRRRELLFALFAFCMLSSRGPKAEGSAFALAGSPCPFPNLESLTLGIPSVPGFLGSWVPHPSFSRVRVCRRVSHQPHLPAVEALTFASQILLRGNPSSLQSIRVRSSSAVGDSYWVDYGGPVEGGLRRSRMRGTAKDAIGNTAVRPVLEATLKSFNFARTGPSLGPNPVSPGRYRYGAIE